MIIARHPFIYKVVLALLVFACWSPMAWANTAILEEDCRREIKQQNFREAGDCYVRLFKSLGTKEQSIPNTPLQKDRLLHQAALIYFHLTKQSSVVHEKAYYRERASQLLMQSFRKGYCAVANRCRSHRRLADKLRKEVQYTPLAIVTGQRTAKIRITGFRFQQTKYFSFNRKLRPGRYTVTLTYPGQNIRTQTVVLRPGFGVTVNATPIRVKLLERRLLIPQKVPPLVVVGYVSGSLLFAVGLATAIYGFTEDARINKIISDPIKARTLPPKEYNKIAEQCRTIKTVGIVVAGTGSAFVLSTLISHLVTNRSHQHKKEILLPYQNASNKKHILLFSSGDQR